MAWAAAGLALLAVAFAGRALDLPLVAQSFYVWAWWGWILVLDAFCAWRRGGSLLTTRRRIALPVALSSVSFWFLFEALNLRFQNWYYVGCYALVDALAVLTCAVFVVLAFATVFVGIFETIDALGALGAWRAWRGRERRFSRRTSWVVQGVGAAMAALAVLFPMWLAPLVWGSLSLLVDPWNYRRGRRSLLRDVERGDFGRVARVLAGGLVCGVVWESLNFVSPQKWIYTVRGLEGFKVFEMPLLGFLGFPALALDSVTAFALLSGLLFGGETWEHPDDAGELTAPAADRRRGFALSLPLQAAVWVVIAFGVMRVNTGSVEYGIERLMTLPARSLGPLEQLGLTRPRRLLRALEGERAAAVRAAAGLDEAAAGEVAEEIRLYEFKGIGPWYGPLLRDVGVRRVEDLGRASVEDLHRRLAARAGELGWWVPREDWVRVWVLAAR